jgi:hypothetical protein
MLSQCRGASSSRDVCWRVGSFRVKLGWLVGRRAVHVVLQAAGTFGQSELGRPDCVGPMCDVSRAAAAEQQ